jgi:hypothetical protein
MPGGSQSCGGWLPASISKLPPIFDLIRRTSQLQLAPVL